MLIDVAMKNDIFFEEMILLAIYSDECLCLALGMTADGRRGFAAHVS